MKYLKFKLETWLDQAFDAIKHCWNNLTQGISNLIRYFKIIWKDRDFDYAYIYYLLDKKLEFIQKRYETKYLFERQENELKYIKLVRRLINMSLNEYYSSFYFSFIHGEGKYLSVRDKNQIEIMFDKTLSKNYKKIYDKHQHLSIKSRRIHVALDLDKKCDALIWKILSNKIGLWWD